MGSSKDSFQYFRGVRYDYLFHLDTRRIENMIEYGNVHLFKDIVVEARGLGEKKEDVMYV